MTEHELSTTGALRQFRRQLAICGALGSALEHGTSTSRSSRITN